MRGVAGLTHAVLVGERGHDAGGEIVREGSPEKDKVVEAPADLRVVTGIGGQVGVGGDEVRDKGVAGAFEFDFAVADVDVPHALVAARRRRRWGRGGGWWVGRLPRDRAREVFVVERVQLGRRSGLAAARVESSRGERERRDQGPKRKQLVTLSPL